MEINLIKQTNFISFDGNISLSTNHQHPDRFRHLDTLTQTEPLIARGGGYSYSAASFGKNVLVEEMTSFDRFLEFDPEQLTIKVEAGVSLASLLNWAVKYQLYFPVLPGYPSITVGGCIAVDAHGKNPYRDGTFSDWVKQLTVFHPSKGYQIVSPAQQPELFALTCGGFGLTGIIVDATLQLQPLSSNSVATVSTPVLSLMDAIESLSRSEGDFCYSWHDATPTSSFGKGIIFGGRWSANNQIEINFPSARMNAQNRGRLPFSVWNKTTASVANKIFLKTNASRQEEKSIFNAAFPFASNTLFHRLFGRPGLREAQILIPEARISSFIQSLEKLVSETKSPTMMISMKRFNGRQKSLSVSGSGYLVAIDCFQDIKTSKFYNQLDELMLAEKGQPNLSKDSRLSATIVQSSLPYLKEFQRGLNKYDPDRQFRSELSTRIGL